MEIVTVESVDDLKPYDMVLEGRTVIRIDWPGGVTTATVRAQHEDVNGMCLKRPHIEDECVEKFDYPVRVMRPGPIPDLPCERCSADRQGTPSGGPI